MNDDFFEKDELITQKIIKFGSLVGILNNKDISVVAFFNILLQDMEMRLCFCEYMDMDFLNVARVMGRRYDILGKSKKIMRINDESTENQGTVDEG